MTRPPALIALAALALFASACGGAGGEPADNGDSPGGGSPGGGAPAGLALVVFRDAIQSKLFARSITDGRLWELAVDPEEFVTSIDCTRDGVRAAYLKKNLQTGGAITVSGAADRPIPVPGEATGLAWTPDGSRLAVTSFDPANRTNQVAVVTPEIGRLTAAATGSGPIGSPRWSPDGSKIAYDAAYGTSNQLFVYTFGEQEAVKVATAASPAFAPDWSPHGSSLVFTAPAAANLSQLFTIDAVDGANERQLTSSEVSKGFPRWSPDGSTVAFAGTIFIPVASSRPLALHNLAVYTMQPDGTGEQVITDVVQDAWLLGWCVSGPWLNEGWQEVPS
jgi:hypothetical protein